MIFKQYYLGCLAHASYLVGDEKSGVAAVVDPQRDVDGYIADAAASGLTIKHVILTHFHADFVSGQLELKARTGASIHLGTRANAEYPFSPLRDGAEIPLGSVRLRALETPGHTPESICVLVFDDTKDAANPHAVLTGDTLFIGDVGRPDLLASIGWTARDLAAMLFDSLRNKLMTLPDETLVYPAHGAGSFCGKAMSNETVSTIGAQKRLNYALQPIGKSAFVTQVTAGQPEMPPYFGYDAALNRKRHATLDVALEQSLHPLALDDVLRRMNAGAIVLDTREPADYDPQHLAGSLNIGLSGKYCTWAGTVIDREHPIVIVADPGKERESALRLGRIGFDHVAGYLQDGIAAVAGRPELLDRTERIEAAALDAELKSRAAPLVLDVRAPAEVSQKRIPGSLAIPLPHLEKRIAEIPRERRVVVHCAGGFRSAIACSMLKKHGYTMIADLVGGLSAWEKAQPATAPS